MSQHRASRSRATLTACLLGIAFMTGLLLMSCASPTVTPIPSPTVPPPVTVDLSDKIDGQGTLLADVVVTSSDGRARLELTKGTRVLDAQNRPAKSITVTPLRRQASESADAFLSGWAYDFGGLTVRPLAQLTISYDPPPSLSNINAQDPQIGGFWEEQKLWVKTKNSSTADVKAHTVSVKLGNPATFMVLFWYTAKTPPIS